jgi:RHS repeat-associated protein
VNQASQSINFTAPPSSATYGTSPITLSATGGASGNAVTFSVVSGPATVSGSTLTITGAGTIVVAANQAGNGSYSAAAQVTHNITVNKATVTVTASNASRAYEAANPAFSATYSGFVNGDTQSVLSGTPSFTTTATSSSSVGTYTITPATGTLSASNYTFSFASGTLTITKASQSITFSAPTSPVTYGVTPIALSASATSGLGVTFSVVSGPGTVAGSTLTITGSGAVVVAANQTGNGNYSAASQVTQSVTVNKHSLVVTANNATRVYGAVNPTFTPAYSGFVNGDTSSVLSGTPSLTTTATTTSVVGSYAITAATGSLTAANYSFTFSNGTLTITQATPTITWSTPATVPNGSILSSVQLNATANTQGSYAYTPASGATLTPGVHQLSVTFTPNDTTDYTTATKTVSLTVSLAPATGIIATIAGNETEGYTGNGGPALSAEFFIPAAVAMDSQGNVYIADTANNVIRKVTASTDTVTTYAGNATAGYTGDGGAATSAELNQPGGVAVDSQGNLYIADSYNIVIRKVTPAGIISTVAGNGTNSYSGDGGAATSAGLAAANGVAVDTTGNIYIAASSRIRKVNTSGIISTIAGTGTNGVSGDGGAATSAELNYAVAVAVDSGGNVYIADQNNCRIRKVSTSGIISTLAGDGSAPACAAYSGDGGPATSASLGLITGVAVDAAGNVYIADAGNQVIRKVSTAGTIVTDAGTPDISGFTGDFGPAIDAQLSGPSGVAIDGSGNLFIADTYNNVIRAVGGGLITPTISWPLPAAIVYRTALSGTQLNASSGGIAGSFSYSPVSGTVLSVGQQTLTATFTPTDTSDYSPVSVTVPLTVVKATPAITWATPAAIADGTALSSTQLNASSSVAGTIAYLPVTGTVLSAGAHLLSATFTPTDTADYQTVVANVSIDVQTGTHKQDSGTVTLSVNIGSGYALASSATYSAGSTPSSVAASLVSGLVAGAPVSVSAVDDQITIASTATGSAVNYPFLIETSTWDSTDFAQPSFVNPAISGTLDGGAAASSSQTPQPVYSFTIPASGGYDASGNILSYTDSVMGTWSYSYDTLNRLSTGSQTAAGSQALSSLPNLCWNYDAFGNRLQQYGASAAFESGSGGPNTCQGQSSGTVSTALASFDQNNRMTSTNERGVTAQVTYDASGNVTWDGVNYYLYDAESRICAVASTAAGTPIMTGYMYDADGIRVSKGAIQQWSCNPTTAQYATQTDYIIGPGGEQMSEYAMQPGNTMAWVHTNVWAAGRLLATYAQDSSSTMQQGLIHFYFDDPLGSRRAQTDYAGNLEQDCGNLPYGDGETCAPTPTEHLFTNKERDSESGNDYFGARYYASAMGRFLSPDWSAAVEPVPYSKLDDPQTLNLYAYVLNNPIARGDIDGHVPLSWGGIEDCGERNDCSENVEEKLQAGMENQANVEANKVFTEREQAQQQNSAQGQQALKYKTISGGKGSKEWTIQWQLSKKSKAGGEIVQQISTYDKSGKREYTYWEAWSVPKGSKFTSYYPDPKDDIFRDYSGNRTDASARFYEGLKLPSSFLSNNPGTYAGILPSTGANPNLPTSNATAPVDRTWTAP